MPAQNLKEFAENLRVRGDWREAEFAAEILALLDLETEVAEPYSELCGDLDNVAPDGLTGRPEKQMEWVIDRSNLLEEIEEELAEDGRTGDTDDQVKALLATLEDARLIIGSPDGCSDETFLQELQALADRVPPLEYDL